MTPEAVAAFLNDLTPTERERFVSALQVCTVFCWVCWYGNDGTVCHCDNDE